MAVSVPELTGALHLPRRGPSGREWATGSSHYRVRVGWRATRVSDNLLDVLLLVDGRHTIAEIADELERRQRRTVHVAEVAYLLRERLGAAGVVRLHRGRLPVGPLARASYATATVQLADEQVPASAAAAPAALLAPAPVLQLPEPAASPVDALTRPVAAADPAVTVADPAPSLPAASAPHEAESLRADASLIAERVATEDAERAAEDAENAEDPLSSRARVSPLSLSSVSSVSSAVTFAPASATPPSRVDDAAALVLPAETPPVPAGEEPTLVLPRDDTRPPAGPPSRPFASAYAASFADAAALAPLAPERSLDEPERLRGDEGAAPYRRRPRRGILLVGSAALLLVFGLVVYGAQSGLFSAQTVARVTPTAAPTATPPQARILPGETAYTVLSGDTLSSVAARVHVSAEALALVNADVLGSSNTLVSGMRLAIPATYKPGVPADKQPRPLYYTLRPGDTLSALSQRFGVDWHTIADYNHITDQYNLAVGLGIIIPAQP